MCQREFFFTFYRFSLFEICDRIVSADCNLIVKIKICDAFGRILPGDLSENK